MGGNHLAFAPKLYRLELQSRILGHMIRILELLDVRDGPLPQNGCFLLEIVR